MMTRDREMFSRGAFLAHATGLLTGLMLISAVTGTFSVAFAKNATAQQAHTRTAIDSHQFPPWRVAPAHGILLKDLKTGRVLYEHDAGKRMSPASLTKIMSALVILEKGHLDDLVTISPNAARAHKTHLRVKAGQVFRLEDLLKAMLIMSANDACLAAVEHVGGDEAQFVTLMNAKAAALGLADTHFSNGCGFDNPDHYSTAEDLAALSLIALDQPIFRQLVREERAIITAVNGHHAYILHTTNKLLGRIPGVEGIKTGFTSKAGRCLIAKVSQNGSDLLLVILNSNRRWNTATNLITYGLQVVDAPH
ncbi:MAG: D-alanyl-D-alanine carboxypeptidase family protein [Nitrospirota bacterium]|nr:D-alanyl-D-alanine carboxypeptidase family protein [Nitrospirota bacterium]MDP2383850.1 D-alanyl-D-alanine carboxypeptidase family protein [Nitrospirota bacterium]MDP3599429.1 D-alanyl-D-alanine carboxypeptidase family protein [Nitrospirota bacterium]